MVLGHNYELWNGKEVVGHFHSIWVLKGLSISVAEKSTFKQKYNEHTAVIKVPMIRMVIADNGMDVTLRTCLDVRKKSRRQIEILRKGSRS